MKIIINVYPISPRQHSSRRMNTKLFVGNQLAFKLTFAQDSNFVSGEETLVLQR